MCQVAPRPADEVFALLGMAEGAGEALPAADRTPVPAPPWVAADEETVAAAMATTQEWLACINADDNFRIAALLTEWCARSLVWWWPRCRRGDRGGAGPIWPGRRCRARAEEHVRLRGRQRRLAA